MINIRFIYCFFVLISLGACARKSVAPIIEDQDQVISTNTQKESNKLLLDSIQNQPWNYFSSKIDVTYANEEKSISVKINAKSTKDSASFFIVSFFNIPVVLAMASHDSVMYLDKNKRCYEQKAIQELQSLLGVTLSLSNLEELLLARPIGFRLDALSEEHTGDTLWVYQSQMENTKIRRHTYAISKSNHRLLFQSIEVPEDEINLSITYADYFMISNVAFPKRINLSLSIKNQVSNIVLNYDKTVFNTAHYLELNIPDDYENCH